ncbi:kappaPI-actitoxin-Avd3d-like [Episyrphus balteatus]|uniref:kappaPI-actitoxin-Avd3d-like n=1 Tax=Episyrphus balteatus TaxID=286459 RepID=UPI0024863684|nr:kappaPI-actitoxin-Avd3d-like [Episyrphus balteatus]
MDFSKILFLLVLTISCVYSSEIPKECIGMEPNAIGVCRKLFFGYYFNIITKECQKYETGGCYMKAGNAHSFPTIEECIEKCKGPMEAAASKK